jgi:hypothetical protein
VVEAVEEAEVQLLLEERVSRLQAVGEVVRLDLWPEVGVVALVREEPGEVSLEEEWVVVVGGTEDWIHGVEAVERVQDSGLEERGVQRPYVQLQTAEEHHVGRLGQGEVLAHRPEEFCQAVVVEVDQVLSWKQLGVS